MGLDGLFSQTTLHCLAPCSAPSLLNSPSVTLSSAYSANPFFPLKRVIVSHAFVLLDSISSLLCSVSGVTVHSHLKNKSTLHTLQIVHDELVFLWDRLLFESCDDRKLIKWESDIVMASKRFFWFSFPTHWAYYPMVKFGIWRCSLVSLWLMASLDHKQLKCTLKRSCGLVPILGWPRTVCPVRYKEGRRLHSLA